MTALQVVIGVAMVVLGLALIVGHNRVEEFWEGIEYKYGPQPRSGTTSARGTAMIGCVVLVMAAMM